MPGKVPALQWFSGYPYKGNGMGEGSGFRCMGVIF